MSEESDRRRRLGELMLADERRLRRRLDGLAQGARPRAAALAAIDADIAAARSGSRGAGRPCRASHTPRRCRSASGADEIAAAIRDHQVVIVAGETGSGKTTQLPKICLELGRGVRGMIGHTQPRRIAARTVADRVAEELGTPLGDDGRLQGALHRPDRATTRSSRS